MVGAPEVENLMTTNWLGLPLLASSNGQQIDSLIAWIHVFMFILFIGWGAFFLFVLFRFSAKRHPKADYHGVQSHASSYLEGAVLVVELVLLFVPVITHSNGFWIH